MQLREIGGILRCRNQNPPKPQGAAALHRGHTGHQHARERGGGGKRTAIARKSPQIGKTCGNLRTSVFPAPPVLCPQDAESRAFPPVTATPLPTASVRPQRPSNLRPNRSSNRHPVPLRPFQPPPPPRLTFRRVVAPLRGPGQSPVLPSACCVGSLRSVGRCGQCSCWCRFRVRGAQSLVCWGCAGCGGMCRLRVSAPPPGRAHACAAVAHRESTTSAWANNKQHLPVGAEEEKKTTNGRRSTAVGGQPTAVGGEPIAGGEPTAIGGAVGG